MTGEAENRNQIDDLIIGHFDRTLNEEQEMELADALTSSGEAKETFLSYMRMEGRLHSMGRDGFLREPPAELAIEPERPAPQPVVDEPVVRSDRQRLRLIAASTSLVVCAVVILMLSSGVLWPSSVSASSVLQRAQQVAAEMVDRRYRLVESRETTQGGSPLRDLVITVRGRGRFVVQPEHGGYVMGSDGTDYWVARRNGPVCVTSDFRKLAPELKKRIPNRSLLHSVLASPEEPLLLEMSGLLRLIERRYDIELVKSGTPAEHHVRATRRSSLRGGASVINLKADAKSGVVFWAEMNFADRKRTFELIETPTLSSQWYHHSEHAADRPVVRLDATD